MGLQYPTIRAEDILLREQFINPQYLADNGGTAVAAPTISNGVTLNGTTQHVTYAKSFLGVKSVSIVLKATTTSEDIIDLDGGTHTIEVGAGTITATGFAAPTIYVNGAVSSTLTTDLSVITITTATAFDATALDIGKETTYFDGQIASVELYSKVLTAGEVDDIFKEQTFSEVDVSQLEFFLPLRSHYNTGSTEVTPNLGTVGTDTIKWGDGTVGATSPTLLDNNGASLDGNQYIGAEGAFTIARTDSYSFGCLFSYDQAASRFLFDFRNLADEGFSLLARSADFQLLYDNVQVGADGVGDFSDGTWHSVICTLAPSGGANTIYSIYVDGELDVTNTTTSFTGGTVDAYIGTEIDITDLFIGSIKFPFFWKTSLTPTQIKWQHELLFRQFNL